MNAWEFGSKYKFTIYYNEQDTVNIKHENRAEGKKTKCHWKKKRVKGCDLKTN